MAVLKANTVTVTIASANTDTDLRDTDIAINFSLILNLVVSFSYFLNLMSDFVVNKIYPNSLKTSLDPSPIWVPNTNHNEDKILRQNKYSSWRNSTFSVIKLWHFLTCVSNECYIWTSTFGINYTYTVKTKQNTKIQFYIYTNGDGWKTIVTLIEKDIFVFISVTNFHVLLGKKYCYGSTEGQYCHCDFCKCKHGFGSEGYGHCHR